jgi:ribose/xylose/arabinose/galactoside ABC-type transport system permease subunit
MSLVIGLVLFAAFIAAGVVFKLYKNQWFWGVVAIIVLLCLNLLKDPGYLAIDYVDSTGRLVGNLLDIVRWAAPTMLIATGMALVIATRGIDLSVGSSMVAGGAASLQFLSTASPTSASSAAVAVLLAVLTGGAIGAVNGLLVTYVRLQPFITTLVMMMAGRGIAKSSPRARTPRRPTTRSSGWSTAPCWGSPWCSLSRSPWSASSGCGSAGRRSASSSRRSASTRRRAGWRASAPPGSS